MTTFSALMYQIKNVKVILMKLLDARLIIRMIIEHG